MLNKLIDPYTQLCSFGIDTEFSLRIILQLDDFSTKIKLTYSKKIPCYFCKSGISLQGVGLIKYVHFGLPLTLAGGLYTDNKLSFRKMCTNHQLEFAVDLPCCGPEPVFYL